MVRIHQGALNKSQSGTGFSGFLGSPFSLPRKWTSPICPLFVHFRMTKPMVVLSISLPTSVRTSTSTYSCFGGTHRTEAVADSPRSSTRACSAQQHQLAVSLPLIRQSKPRHLHRPKGQRRRRLESSISLLDPSAHRRCRRCHRASPNRGIRSKQTGQRPQRHGLQTVPTQPPKGS